MLGGYIILRLDCMRVTIVSTSAQEHKVCLKQNLTMPIHYGPK